MLKIRGASLAPYFFFDISVSTSVTVGSTKMGCFSRSSSAVLHGATDLGTDVWVGYTTGSQNDRLQASRGFAF